MSYDYFFEQGDPDTPTLLLLHGTGGDEMQLVDLARAAAPGATLVALRGNVNENGKLRFFRRLADGVLDEADIRERAAEAATFLASLFEEKMLRKPIVIGYSNGANFAAAMMLLGQSCFRAAILMRAVAPFSERPSAALAAIPVLMLSGERDSEIDVRQTRRLEVDLIQSGAAATHFILAADHSPCAADLNAIALYMEHFNNRPDGVTPQSASG